MKLIQNIFNEIWTSETTLTIKIILSFYKVRVIDAYYINKTLTNSGIVISILACIPISIRKDLFIRK